MVLKPLIRVVSECSLNNLITIDDCGKCPYNNGLNSQYTHMNCGYDDEKAKKLAPEKAKKVEPKSRW